MWAISKQRGLNLLFVFSYEHSYPETAKVTGASMKSIQREHKGWHITQHIRMVTDRTYSGRCEHWRRTVSYSLRCEHVYHEEESRGNRCSVMYT